MSLPSNPWFAVAIGLTGVIVGYGAGSLNPAADSGPTAPQPPAVADAPIPAPVPAPAPTAGDVPPVDTATDHIRGNPNATISIIEYSDFECPYCASVHPTLQRVLDAYGDDVHWVYRHFPLSFHPFAQPAAEASECVAELGGNDAFWEFTDLIFEQGVGSDNFREYVRAIGLNEKDYQDCMESDTYTQFVKDQMAGGTAAGVRGTPGTIILNNKTQETRLVSGAQPFENFKAAIDALM